MDQKRKNTKHSLAMRLAALVLCGCLCGALYPAAALATEAAAVSETTDTPEPTATPESAAEPTPAPTETPTVVYSAEADGVTVKAEAAEGVLPKDATLSVAVLDGDDKDAAAAELDNSGVQYDGFLALDLTFKKDDGTEIEPNGAVSVSFALTELPEDADTATLAVQHLEEDAAGEVTAVATVANTDTADEETGTVTTDEAKVAEVVETINDTTPEDVTVSADDTAAVAEFTVEKFSTFTITYQTYYYTDTVVATIYDADTGNELDVGDQSYTITDDNPHKLSGMLPSNLTANGNNYTLEKAELTYRSNGNRYRTVEVTHVTRYTFMGYPYLVYTDADGNTYDSGTLKIYYKNTSSSTTDGLHAVETVDSTAKGVTVKMANWNQQPFSGDTWIESYTGRGVKQGVLTSTLESNGYPSLTSNHSISIYGKNTFASLFSGAEEVNHLFIQSVYDETGDFYFDSSEYGAFLDGEHDNQSAQKDFSVYQELVRPANAPTDNKTGAFMPYNTIKNLTSSGVVDSSNRTLYKPDQSDDYYFGMELSADFVQDENGVTNGRPMKYEFTGDDDLWVYIDGVLVLDLGGCHDARSGWIDFSTGEVYVQGNTNNDTVTGLKTEEQGGIYTYDSSTNYYKTTLKKIFDKQNPNNGIQWKTVTLSNGSTGYIFPDYSSHSMKMWYLERGAGTSNLKIRFNLPTIPVGSIRVQKELSNTDKQLYANVDFNYILYVQDINSDGTYKDSYVKYNGPATRIGSDQTTESSMTITNGEFTLKAGETVQVDDLGVNRKYYVVETGVKATEYDKVIVNGTTLVEYNITKNDDGTYTAKEKEAKGNVTTEGIKTSEATVHDRAACKFTNNCSGLNSRELRITKAMQNNAKTSDTFTFKVWLTDKESGKLVPYDGDYYLLDAQKNYCYYENGSLKSNGKVAKVCGQTINGAVSGVGVGYTVVVTQILSGTDFAVQEVGYNSSNYQDPSIKVEKDTYEASENTNSENSVTALGKIKLGTDAEVTVTNIPQPKTLTVTKSVAGGMASTTDNFTFKLALANGSTGTVKDSGGNVIDLSTYTFTLNGGTNNTATFTVPANAQITVTETDSSSQGYATKSINYATATTDASKKAFPTGADSTPYAETVTMTDNMTVAYQNTKNPVVPTGITTDTTPYAVMILAGVVALGGGAVLTLRRKREG